MKHLVLHALPTCPDCGKDKWEIQHAHRRTAATPANVDVTLFVNKECLSCGYYVTEVTAVKDHL